MSVGQVESVQHFTERLASKFGGSDNFNLKATIFIHVFSLKVIFSPPCQILYNRVYSRLTFISPRKPRSTINDC